MSRITIASQLDPEANDFLQARLPNDRLVAVQGLPDIPPDTRAFIVRPINVRGVSMPEPPSGWPFQLEWIQLVSSGIDAYPDWLFTVPRVTTARGTASHSIAEFVLAAIFSAAKHLPDIWVRDARWSFTHLSPVRGTTLGILGFGSIGQCLADKARALDIHVLALGRDNRTIDHPGVESAKDIRELAERSDHLVIAVPLTAATQYLVGRDVLSHSKSGQHLINIAHGGLLDQEALREALDSGRLRLATLDVTDPEPLPEGHWLYFHPRVRISPHTSSVSTDSQRNIAALFLDNLERFKSGRQLLNSVNIARGY
ncbi:D-isomer specific 2-hydroxyacid dehydrogenase family protein [Azomonas macrocytogenes]|uniref:Phosphoglycerate dehydrogenase-like enzyme n=1 Tax=Azomonas macrocytogenes TaxID=69962 RepID=A0A839T250_AZOMA|nr:D-isomer specific 2-hydroxyacid dehydrogenase family protein [Azomonas macrocytogenes]MBB3102710.1 phosphoglycerate dehydrogenase-like enzyme [Azomonas macrocytogenes]